MASSWYAPGPLWAYRPPRAPRKSRTGRLAPPGSELVLKEEHDQYHKSDKELLDSGYMSDCMVICQGAQWPTHKAILCSRNKWFRVALDGPFQEASTGVVTIKDSDPDTVQVVLDYIYGGEARKPCPTPSKIVEIWKAGDFFDIPDLVDAAQNAMTRRLERSGAFLRFDPRGPAAERPRKNTYCQPILTQYGGCGHLVREPRACPVRNASPQTVFHLCVPERVVFRAGENCGKCGKRTAVISGDGGISTSSPPPADRPAPPPDDELRAMVEGEIRALCEALIVATVDTPKGSRVQKALINHMCNARVAAWGGYTVCRFLEA